MASLLPGLDAEEELRIRRTKSNLSPERLKYLVYMTTGDMIKAGKAAAAYYFSTQDSKR